MVGYFAPADRAAVSFVHYYPEYVERLISAMQKAARNNHAWRAFGSFRQSWFREWIDAIRAAQSGGLNPNYKKPNMLNRILPLSCCPLASPNCRKVCLNTSGHGSFAVGQKRMAETKEYRALMAGRDRDGYTLEDDLCYFMLRGQEWFYGGETNPTTSMRVLRTHAAWLLFATTGDVIKNPLWDMIRDEALDYRRVTKQIKVPLAVRINGTSDYPVHTVKCTDGSNLVHLLGKQGIVCYDYTKDWEKMKRWLSKRHWSGLEAIKTSKVPGPSPSREFPGNYWLSLSWHEFNGRRCLKALKMGGNVVMVFRRSVRTKSTDRDKLPAEAGAEGTLPTAIRVSDISKRAEDREWVARIIDGDVHDLRFLDPYNRGKNQSGVIVGLIAKGQAMDNYTENVRDTFWDKFTITGSLMRAGEEVFLIARKNPPVREDAIVEIDPDVLNDATSFIGNLMITTTAMAT